jgi:hypothetical protein
MNPPLPNPITPYKVPSMEFYLHSNLTNLLPQGKRKSKYFKDLKNKFKLT